MSPARRDARMATMWRAMRRGQIIEVRRARMTMVLGWWVGLDDRRLN